MSLREAGYILYRYPGPCDFGLLVGLFIFVLANIMRAMELNDFASLFKSLSEPVRLRILYLLLEKGELCVCDIVDSLELSQSVVSRHLAYLRNGGLVKTRRKGVWIYYQVVDNGAFISALLESFRVAGRDSVSLSYDLERLQSTSSGGCC